MRLNITAKILGGFLAVVALLVVASAIGWNGLNSLESEVNHIVHEALPEDEEVRDLELQVALQSELYFEYALTLDEEILFEAREHTEIIEGEAQQLEAQLAGEPELLALLTRFEE
ncbi:MAG: hypothetical protein O2913_12140 [Chloroflexi bacterium]|nr:hypothetical protein [Chloroflexota bacterium]